jgi:hypothetical protein
MKKFLKLVPAFAMLLVAAILVSTSTYAWFSMNSRVTVTGMTVRTIVNDNLFIAPTTFAEAGHAADADFVKDATQTVTGLLEPVSTINGKNFFYTENANVLASGDARTDTYITYDPTDLTDFNTNYGTSSSGFETTGTEGAVGYKDFYLELKAVNTSTSPSALKLTNLNLIYPTGAEKIEKAFRVAVFVQKFGDNDSDSATPDAYTMVSEATLPAATSIFSESGATNFTATKAVKTTSTLDTVLTPNAAVSVNVAAGATEYYKVVVRLWLEGEDNTCNNETFAALKNNWSLNLAFELNTSTAATTNIAKYQSAVVSGTTYYYDGTSVWSDVTKIGIAGDATAIGSAAADVQTAFGYTAP